MNIHNHYSQNANNVMYRNIIQLEHDTTFSNEQG